MSVSQVAGVDRFAERVRWAVGQRIRSLREARGMTGTVLGQLAGVTSQNVSQHELGEKSVSQARAVMYARALSVKPSEILSVLDGVA